MDGHAHVRMAVVIFHHGGGCTHNAVNAVVVSANGRVGMCSCVVVLCDAEGVFLRYMQHVPQTYTFTDIDVHVP